MPSYDILRNWIEEYSDRGNPKLRPYAPVIAGAVARSLACITCSPIELARTRMQVSIFNPLFSKNNVIKSKKYVLTNERRPLVTNRLCRENFASHYQSLIISYIVREVKIKIFTSL